MTAQQRGWGGIQGNTAGQPASRTRPGCWAGGRREEEMTRQGHHHRKLRDSPASSLLLLSSFSSAHGSSAQLTGAAARGCPSSALTPLRSNALSGPQSRRQCAELAGRCWNRPPASITTTTHTSTSQGSSLTSVKAPKSHGMVRVLIPFATRVQEGKGFSRVGNRSLACPRLLSVCAWSTSVLPTCVRPSTFAVAASRSPIPPKSPPLPWVLVRTRKPVW